MKKLTTIVAATLLSASTFAQTLQTEKDSASYAMGIYQALSTDKEISEYVSIELFAQGFYDVIFKKGNTLIAEEKVNEILQNYFQKLSNKEQEEKQELCLANQDFLLKNKENKDVITTESGLQYKIITKGTGAKPTAADTVTVHYKGTLIDGTVFDSSIDRGTPTTFPVMAVIPGFSEALQLMNIGSKYIIYIPSELGYGMMDMGVIKPCSTLIFELELLAINNDSKATGNTKKSKKK
ncbi:MAG: FKBP-type peptidyl-prolyl cis-trans isomerase [Bacteroidales bacterium]|nr:FKBP-type peptidyl-prolyl cis-trans isomerase [Bacteroidales bacterium]